MRISETVEHAADPERVLEMLCSSDYQDLKCERSGSLEHEVVIEVEEEATTVVTRRRLPTDGFPDFARSFVGEAVDVIETQRWGPEQEDGGRTAVLTVELPRTPVHLTGSVRLEPSENGTLQTVEGELKARVPLLGGRIEQAVAPVISSAVRLEAAVGRDWLRQHGTTS